LLSGAVRGLTGSFDLVARQERRNSVKSKNDLCPKTLPEDWFLGKASRMFCSAFCIIRKRSAISTTQCLRVALLPVMLVAETGAGGLLHSLLHSEGIENDHR
jgi:hypothetical protein